MGAVRPGPGEWSWSEQVADAVEWAGPAAAMRRRNQAGRPGWRAPVRSGRRTGSPRRGSGRRAREIPPPRPGSGPVHERNMNTFASTSSVARTRLALEYGPKYARFAR